MLREHPASAESNVAQRPMRTGRWLLVILRDKEVQ